MTLAAAALLQQAKRLAELRHWRDEIVAEEKQTQAHLEALREEREWVEDGIRRSLASEATAGATEASRQAVPASDTPTLGDMFEQRTIRSKKMNATYKQRIIDYLSTVDEPQLAAEIARGMAKREMIRDYRKEKPAVDSALKRMKETGEAIRDEQGWRLKGATVQPLAQQNGHP